VSTNALMIWCYWLSLVALLATKAFDVRSTWCHIGAQAETNPIARSLFSRLGLGRGMAVVCTAYLLLAGSQYLLVWRIGSSALTWANSGLGFFIALVQWQVARFNSTGRATPITRLAMRGHARWSMWWGRVRSGR
jgi:hypothetical protein